MNNNISNLLEEFDSLYRFSEFLPIELRLEYISKIELLRDKISGNNIYLNNEKQITNTTKKDNLSSENNVSSFKMVTSCLIPNIINDKIKNNEYDDQYLSLINSIDGKASIYDLYSNNVENYKNFFDFASLLYQLESKQDISFTKKECSIHDRGWLKIGEILSNSDIISQKEISDALSHQENKQNIFIGEAMIDLKLINDITLRDSLKIQRWIFKIAEYSPVGSDSKI